MHIFFRVLWLPVTMFFINTLNLAIAQEKNLNLEPVYSRGKHLDFDILYMIRDHQGFLWIYTKPCVYRYDGFSCREYNYIPNQDWDTRHLLVDPKGRIWLNNGRNIYLYNSFKDSFYLANVPFKLETTRRLSFFNQRDTTSYFVQGEHLWKIIPSNPLPILLRSDLHIYQRSYCYLDSKGCFWNSSCDHTIDIFSLDGIFQKNITYPYFCSARFYEDKSQNIYTTSWLDGLIGIDLDDYKTTQYKYPKKDDSDVNIYNELFTISPISGDSILYIGASRNVNTLYRFNLNQKKFLPKIHPLDDQNSKENPIVIATSFLNDSIANSTWIGTDYGLYKADHNEENMHYYNFPQGRDMHHDQGIIVGKVSKDIRQMIYINDENYAFFYNDQGKPNLIKHADLDLKNKKDIIITHLCIDSKNRLWLSCPKGLYLLDRNTMNVLEKYPVPESNFVDTNDKILSDSFDNIWISTRRGLFKFDTKKKKFKKFNNFRFENLNLMSDGNIWAAGSETAFCVDPKTDLYREYSLKFYDLRINQNSDKNHNLFNYIIVDSCGIAYIATNQYIIRLDSKTGKLSRINTKYESRPLGFTSITMDDFGYLWTLDGGNHAYRINPKSGRIQKIRVPLKYGEHRWRVIHKIMDDLYLYDTKYSYLKLKPKDYLDSTNHNKPFLMELKVLGQHRDISSYLEHHKSVEIQPNENNIEFHYSLINLKAKYSDVKIEYMLEGFDKEWQVSNLDWKCMYTNLDEGNYIFRLRCQDENDNWSNQVEVLALKVYPPFVRSKVFYLICLVTAVLFGYFLNYLRTYTRSKQVELQREISRDLHDDIGSALSTIALLSDSSVNQNQVIIDSNLKLIGEEAREINTKMRDIIWLLNQESGKIGEICIKLNQFALPLMDALNIQFEFNCSMINEEVQLNLNQRKQIYFAYKEMINNVIKHSKASKVTVNIANKAKFLYIMVEDNGVGLDHSNIHNGYGLKNLNHRAKQLNGNLIINSIPHQKTTFTFSIPV